MELYSDLRVLIPVGAIFVIVFAIVFRTMQDIPIFSGENSKPARAIVALCVTTLAVLGMDQVFIRPILLTYAAMGYAVLMGLAALLLITWIGIIFRTKKGGKE